MLLLLGSFIKKRHLKEAFIPDAAKKSIAPSYRQIWSNSAAQECRFDDDKEV
jgi:hypothetical protein